MNSLDNINIILVNTLAPGNIGSAARAMNNMGISRMVLVEPRCTLSDEAYWLATNAKDVLSSAKHASSVREAVSTANYMFGTTSRTRKWRTFISPKEMGKKIASLAAQNKIAIVFGPEDSGLTNDQLELCSEVVSIPSAKEGGSINLSHAVAIICYEIYCAVSRQRMTAPKQRRLADAGEVENMYDHMRSALLNIGFLNRQNHEHTLGSFRRLLTRANLTGEEVRLVRGVFRQLLWYMNKKKG